MKQSLPISKIWQILFTQIVRPKPPLPFCLVATRNKIGVRDLKDSSETQRESFFVWWILDCLVLKVYKIH